MEQGFVEKFLQLYDQFEIIDIVPICRNIFRGPEFSNPLLVTKLEEFLLSKTEQLEKLQTSVGKNNDEFNKCLMYFEGCCMAYE